MLDKIKNNEYLYYIGKVLSRSTDAWFRSKVLEIDKRNDAVVLKCFGNENIGTPLYLIEYDKEKSGFFAVLNHFCRYYEFAGRFGLTPVCSITENWLFASGKNKNPFLDYFEQPGKISLESAKNSRCVIYSDYKHVGGEIYNYDDEYIVRISEIAKKYVRFNQNILDLVQKDYCKLGLKGRVLGIHVRGSDFKRNFNKHPAAVSVDEYIKVVKDLCSQYDSIFLATDDLKYLERFRDEDAFKGKLFCYDCSRSDSDVSPSFLKNERENNQFYLAYEVIRDMLTLSRCNGFIGGKSFVSMFARVFNKAQEPDYEDCIILDKGLNRNNNQIDVYEKK